MMVLSYPWQIGYICVSASLSRVGQRKGTVMKAKPEWIKQWEKTPQARVSVIIHTEGNPKQYVETAQEKGLLITHTFRLTKTIAASGPAQIVLDLLQAAWVTKIEPDQKITTMK
jgi:hypothetical protein